MTISDTNRCSWCHGDDLYRHYHDFEWGVPCRDDQRLFEFLVLEAAQAGLSWITVLRKREYYRTVLDNFSPEKIASYDSKKIEALLQDTGIIRNRLKVQSAVTNARAFLNVQQKHSSFANFAWSFVDGEPIQNHFNTIAEIPSSTVRSNYLSKALKRSGFSFVGPTICYAFMQATGMVNDHLTMCHCHTRLLNDSTLSNSQSIQKTDNFL